MIRFRLGFFSLGNHAQNSLTTYCSTVWAWYQSISQFHQMFLSLQRLCGVFSLNFTVSVSEEPDYCIYFVCLSKNTCIREQLQKRIPPDSVSHPSTEKLIEKLWTLLCTVKSITLLSPPIPIRFWCICVRAPFAVVCVRECTSWWWVNCKWMKIHFVRHRTARSRHKWVLRYTIQWNMRECVRFAMPAKWCIGEQCLCMSSNANFPPSTWNIKPKTVQSEHSSVDDIATTLLIRMYECVLRM